MLLDLVAASWIARAVLRRPSLGCLVTALRGPTSQYAGPAGQTERKMKVVIGFLVADLVLLVTMAWTAVHATADARTWLWTGVIVLAMSGLGLLRGLKRLRDHGEP